LSGVEAHLDADNNPYSEESLMLNKTLVFLAFAAAPCSALAAQPKNLDPTAFLMFLGVVVLIIAGFGTKIWLNEKKRRENLDRDAGDTHHRA